METFSFLDSQFMSRCDILSLALDAEPRSFGDKLAPPHGQCCFRGWTQVKLHCGAGSDENECSGEFHFTVKFINYTLSVRVSFKFDLRIIFWSWITLL